MTKWVLVDTDILIDVGRNVQNAVAYLDDLERDSTVVISAITQMELIIGCQNKRELQAVETFVKRFDVLGLSGEITKIAVDLLRKYRLSHGLLIADGLIAATAIAHDLPFVLKNQRDYRFIDGLNLRPYPIHVGE